MQEQNEEDIVVRKKVVSHLTDQCDLLLYLSLQWSILSLHMDIYHLTAFWDQRWHARSCLKHPLMLLLLWHTYDKDFMELVTWSGPCSTGRAPAQDSRMQPWCGQDRRLEFLSLHRGQTTCTQWVTDAWAQPGNWWNPGRAGRGIVIWVPSLTFF